MNYLMLLLLYLCSNVCYAGDNKYVDIKKGAIAPFGGKLFTNDAIAKILSDNELALNKCKINKNAELQSLNADWELRYNLLNKKHTLETKMYSTMLNNRDDLPLRRG